MKHVEDLIVGFVWMCVGLAILYALRSLGLNFAPEGALLGWGASIIAAYRRKLRVGE